MTALPRSTPAAQGVDPGAVLALVDSLEADPDVELHSLMVVRGGHVVAESWWSPYGPERPHLLYSLSKSFTSTALAFAVREGLVDLDETLVSCFPEYDADVLDPRSRRIRLRHLAAMASGHTRDMLDEAVSRDPQEPVRGFLLQPPEREPGTCFAYNQPCTYSLAAVIQRRAGQRLSAYLRPRLFDPLGIGEVGWQAYPPGRELGFTGLHARTEDVAKLGLLYLRKGRWEGRRLIEESWVDEATRRHIDTPEGGEVDWRQGYGYQFWMARHGYRGDGAHGQLCVVLPEHDTVLVTTAATERVQVVLDAVWEHLLPGLGGAGDAAREAELADRLAATRIRPKEVEAQPPDWEPWLAATFRSRHPVWPRAHSAITGAQLSWTGSRLRLALMESDDELSFPVGFGDWAVSSPASGPGQPVPVAAAGGWWDAHTFRVELIFLENPHRLDLTLTLPDHALVATWRIPPLGSDRLSDQRSPQA